jgi:GntR family carbon starvation induced transcriptional regulator
MNKLAFAWGPAPRLLRADAPKTLADEAYQHIRRDIINGVFAPGEKLQPDALRKLYNIGLSPIREALSRVALEGLAVAEGQRGFFAAPALRGELADISDLRINLAMMALERSIRLGADEWENNVVTTYYQLNKLEKQARKEPRTYTDEWEQRNRAFHRALESGCESPWLMYFCEILYDQLERYRRLFVVYTGMDEAIAEEHRQIMELALARDTRACDVLRHHFEHAARVIGSMMEKAEASAKREGGKPQPSSRKAGGAEKAAPTQREPARARQRTRAHQT